MKQNNTATAQTAQQPHIIKTTTPRTAMHNGTAQVVVTATWDNGTQTTEATASLTYFSDHCTRKV